MEMNAVWDVTQAVLVSLGGGGTIVLGLSNWIGKHWADQLMRSETAKHDRELADHKAKQEKELTALRTALEHQSSEALEQIKAQWDVAKEKHLKGFSDKLTIYREGAELLSEMLGSLDEATFGNHARPEKYFDFNTRRMKIYAHIGMIAPQAVMDAYDDLVDYLIMVAQGKAGYNWISGVRPRSLKLLNEIRKDVGLDASEIVYNGNL